MGKVALVTGATGGIGKAIALELAFLGYDIGVHYRNNEEGAKLIVKQIEAMGQKAMMLGADLSKPDQCQAIVEKCCELGDIFALVNNAGITKDALVMRMEDDDFSGVIEANLNSCFYMTKNVMPLMLKKRCGRIINIASVIGITGNAGQANYAASKSGMIGFSKSCAKEVAKRGICVNVVAPGYITTPMTDVLSDEVKKGIQAKIPLKRLGNPEDISGVVGFLCSDKASYITGQVLPVDGGMVI
jgi:3-oxoacyl-[acyl-carrier protein] reductase